MAILSGQLKVPQSAINPCTLKKAGFQGPTMPWIDLQKEITAEEKAVQSGFKSRAQVIRERGGNPQDIFEQIKQEREQENEAGISFTTSQPAKAAADIAESRALYKTYNTGIKWVDVLNGTVRPVIAYSFFILYAVIKAMQFSADLPWLLWTVEDQAIFAGIISFYFGQRAMSKLRQGR